MSNGEGDSNRPAATESAAVDTAIFWDRRLTVAELREAMASTDHPEHLDLLAHLLREARPDQVWQYCLLYTSRCV